MIKFIREKNDNEDTGADIIFNIDDTGKVTYNTLIREFECFLRACGYHFEGELLINDEKDIILDANKLKIIKRK